MPRFAAQLAGLLQLFELRREYGRHMRQSDALLDAVQRLHGHRSAEGTGAGARATPRATSRRRRVAGLVRWNAAGAITASCRRSRPTSDIEPGFMSRPTRWSAGRASSGCRSCSRTRASATDGRMSVRRACRAPIGSLAIVPVSSARPRRSARSSSRDRWRATSRSTRRGTSALLAAVARGPLEIVWEIEEVSRRARTDSLTGLANRRHFDEQLRRVVAETDRFGGTCSLILLDLDHFKPVNDRLRPRGGRRGAQACRAGARDAVRTVDLCARYGGEEIAVLLPQTAEQGAVELAERLRQTLESRPTRCMRRARSGHGVVRSSDVSDAGPERRLARARRRQGAVRGEGGW